MNALLAIVVLAQVASGASAASCLGACNKGPSSEAVDFLGLDRYASKHFSWFDRANGTLEGANSLFVTQLRSSVGKLEGGAKRAAELLTTLADAKQCDDNVLATLREAQENQLDPSGHRRFETLASYLIPPVLNVCSSYVDQTLATRMRSASAKLKRFLQVVSPLELTGFTMDPTSVNSLEAHLHFYSILGGHRRRLNADQLAKAIKELSKDHAKTVDLKDQIDEEAINKYLLEPCKEIQQTVGNLFQPSISMAHLSPNMYVFVARRSIEFRNIAWTYMACDFILARSETARVISLEQL